MGQGGGSVEVNTQPMLEAARIPRAKHGPATLDGARDTHCPDYSARAFSPHLSIQ